MRVVLLHDALSPGARSDQRDVLAQLRVVEAALAERGLETERIAATLDLAGLGRRLRERRPALVFNLVESLEGHGRLIHVVPALLDVLRLPYTGCPSTALWLTTHKLVAKRMLVSAGLPTPAWVDTERCPRAALGGSYLVKSVFEDASLGLDDDSRVEVRAGEDLRPLLRRRAAELGGEAFAERYVEGRELNLSLLEAPDGPRVLPPAEICFEGFPPGKPRIVGYAAKWDPNSFEYRATRRRFAFAASDRGLLEELTALALRCWDLFDLRGFARVDFRVDGAGRPWILEVNANPCLSPDAGFAASARRAGLRTGELVWQIVTAAARRAGLSLPEAPRAAAPGARGSRRNPLRCARG